MLKFTQKRKHLGVIDPLNLGYIKLSESGLCMGTQIVNGKEYYFVTAPEHSKTYVL